MLAEFVRLGVLYIHLIACCVALGMIITSDIAMVRLLLKGRVPARQDRHDVRLLQVTVSRALIALWVTGVALIAVDALDKGWSYFQNPKLQAKIFIVCLLTLNGVVLHQHVLPAMEKAGTLIRMSFSQSMLAIFAGTVSGVSWLYAAMLGVGRPLSWKYSLVELMAAYPLLIAGGFFSMVMLTAWAKYRHNDEHLAFQPTAIVGAR